MEKLLPIRIGHGMYLTKDLIRLCVVFDKWAFDYEIIDINKLNK